jgi:hypothetical protein
MRKLLILVAIAISAVVLVGCSKKEAPPTPVPVPADAVLQGLAHDTLVLFERARRDDDFTDYYEAMSREYKSFTSPTIFSEAMRRLVDASHDLSEVGNVTPVITKTSIFRNPSSQRTQIIEFEGSFSIEPKPVMFKLRYVDEDGDWLLFTHTIKVEDD